MNVIEFLDKHLVQVDLDNPIAQVPDVEHTECTSFTDLLNVMIDEGIFLTENLMASLAATLAVVISTKLPTDCPLWLFIVGPASSSKSLLLDCIMAHKEICIPLTRLTGIFSGIKGDSDKNDGDMSLVHIINNRCVVNTDFTTILSMGPHMQEAIFGELRPIYEGQSANYYRSDAGFRVYEGITFTMLAGVTDRVHTLNKSDLGERFLKIDILDPDIDHRGISFAAQRRAFQILRGGFENGGVRVKKFPKSMSATAGFIDYLLDRLTHGVRDLGADLSDNLLNTIDCISSVVAHSRIKLYKEGKGSTPVYRPRAELTPRLSTQFIRLAACLSLVLNEPMDSEDVLRIVRKVAFDTAHGYNFDILSSLGNAGKLGMTTDQISSKINLGRSGVLDRCNDLFSVNAVRKYRAKDSKQEFWRLTPQLQAVWNRVERLH